jgi:chromosome segregation ATPase
MSRSEAFCYNVLLQVVEPSTGGSTDLRQTAHGTPSAWLSLEPWCALMNPNNQTDLTCFPNNDVARNCSRKSRVTLSTSQILTAAVLSVGAFGCDDTARAIDHRAEEERAEMRADIEKLKADLRSAEDKIKAQAEELNLKTREASEDAKEAARNSAERSAEAIQQAGKNLERRVDEVDKALANEIRGDN